MAARSPETAFKRAQLIALGLILAVFRVVGLRIVAELREMLVLFVAVLFASAISRPAAVLERRRLSRSW